MKSFLLLILSLMTGCEASSEESEVKACPEGWVEFTCKYPKPNEQYKSIEVVNPIKTIRSKEDMWETKGRVSLYHDTKNKILRVAIKQLAHEDSGDYKCKFYQESHSSHEKDEWKVEVETDGCQTQFTQTAYRTAKTTITCDHPGNKYESKFFCKENGLICEDVLSTNSSLESNGTFSLTETNSGFSMSISNVSSRDAGVYWCGGESNEGSYRAALTKIQLVVKDISNFTRSPTVGQNLTYWCFYPNGAPIKKFICKGEDPSICQRLVSTAQLNMNTGKFSMKDVKEKRNITITVREVTTDDTGAYWCGAKSTDKRRSNPFFHRLVMTVGPTSSISSTQSTAASGGSWLTAIIVVVCVAVLVLILVLVYKRFKRSKNTRNGEAQNNKEDRAYEEIQERPQKLGSGTALKTIYVTANLPTNPSASQYYSTVNFQNSSGEVSGDTYSTVQCPTYSTVNHPSRLSGDPFYCTVNKPHQH